MVIGSTKIIQKYMIFCDFKLNIYLSIHIIQTLKWFLCLSAFFSPNRLWLSPFCWESDPFCFDQSKMNVLDSMWWTITIKQSDGHIHIINTVNIKKWFNCAIYSSWNYKRASGSFRFVDVMKSLKINLILYYFIDSKNHFDVLKENSLLSMHRFSNPWVKRSSNYELNNSNSLVFLNWKILFEIDTCIT